MGVQAVFSREWRNKTCLDYKIIQGNFIGDAFIEFIKIKGGKYKEAFPFCSEGDIIVYLNEFYPNGRTDNPQTKERIKKGVGSKTLIEICSDCKEKNAVLLFTIATTQDMRIFCEKKGFEFTSGTYYKHL